MRGGQWVLRFHLKLGQCGYEAVAICSSDELSSKESGIARLLLFYSPILKQKNLQEGGNRYFFEYAHGSPSQLTPVQLCFPGVISVPSSSTHVRHQFLCVHNRVKSNKFTLNTLNLLSADSRENSETLRVNSCLSWCHYILVEAVQAVDLFDELIWKRDFFSTFCQEGKDERMSEWRVVGKSSWDEAEACECPV